MLVTAADALVLLLVEHWVTQIQEHDCHYLVRAWDQKALAVIVSCMPLTSLLLFTGVLVTAADAFVLLLVEQWGVRQLEAVFGLFIAIMAGSFGIMYKDAGIPHKEVLKGLVA